MINEQTNNEEEMTATKAGLQQLIEVTTPNSVTHSSNGYYYLYYLKYDSTENFTRARSTYFENFMPVIPPSFYDQFKQ